MNEKFNLKITTSTSEEEVVRRIKEYIKKKVGVKDVLAEKPILIGEFKSVGHFKIQTIDTPPIQINGNINTSDAGSTTIDLTFVAHSMKKGLMGLFLGLGYPIVLVIFLISVLQNPTNFWVYFWTIIAFPIIYVFAKVYIFFNYHEPNHKIALDKIVSLVDGEIVSN